MRLPVLVLPSSTVRSTACTGGDNVVRGRPVLRRGETLPAIRRGIGGWRNAGGSGVQCLWVPRD